MRKTSHLREVFLCTLHKAGPGRRQPAEAIIPLYHTFAKKSSEILHKKSIYFFSHFVHFDEGVSCQPPHQGTSTRPICPHMPLKAVESRPGAGARDRKPGTLKALGYFGAEPSYATSIRWKLTYIKKYDIILKKDFFKKHLTILKKYDII